MSRHYQHNKHILAKALTEAQEPDFQKKQARHHINSLHKRMDTLKLEIEHLKRERVKIAILRNSLLTQHFPEELGIGIPRLPALEY